MTKAHQIRRSIHCNLPVFEHFIKSNQARILMLDAFLKTRDEHKMLSNIYWEVYIFNLYEWE